ncbi:hypothetical protein QBC38DRAFT_460911 [Podospora fimiseda]|uniref:LysM domain-containing protein n=1 Tax=Podospora fimiseda TaxID=252190 RepID=A0AAN6YMF1_9PEZI|nr:hypothetical protein QBC38DRAFT_460911 [Podospora fimiseda]
MKAARAVRSTLLLSTLVTGQQFESFRQPYEQLGLSKACTDVLNTLVSCDISLAFSTSFDEPSIDILDPVTLGNICVPECRDNLQSLRTKIISTCNQQTNVIVYGKTAYPATFILDHYIYTYDVSCYADRKTDLCFDCVIGVYTVQLSSPLGYYEELAEQFSSIKSECGTAAATYTYTKTAYSTSPATSTSQTATKTTAISSTTSKAPTGPTTLPLTCDRKYTVVQNDTCNSIALAERASTYDIITLNVLTIWCDNLPKPGAQICLPSPLDEIMAWNPIFSFKCANIKRWWDFVICTGVGNGTISPTNLRTITMTSRTSASSSIRPTISVVPLLPVKPHALGSISIYAKWYDAYDLIDEWASDLSSLNKCRTFVSLRHIFMSDLIAWSPSLKSEYSCVLDPKYSYCIADPATSTAISASSTQTLSVS